ncbi:MAG: hypothetical protein ACREJB_14665, partial [Planctomycetaceae bacterium]
MRRPRYWILAAVGLSLTTPLATARAGDLPPVDQAFVSDHSAPLERLPLRSLEAHLASLEEPEPMAPEPMDAESMAPEPMPMPAPLTGGLIPGGPIVPA